MCSSDLIGVIIINTVNLIGRLTRDPELKFLPNGGTAVTTFSLAVDKQLSKEKKQEMESKNQPTADFINIVVWGKQAENCANYLAKGRLTAIQGRIQTRSWDDNGTRKYATEVVAEKVQFLEWNDKNTSNTGGYVPDTSNDSDDTIPF